MPNEENLIISNLNTGEISPYMSGRVDYEQFYSSCRCIENMIVTAWGPLTRRPGFRYMWEVKDSSQKTCLMDFDFSIEQAYGLEVGNLYMRFGMNRGQIVVDATDAAITNGDFTSDIVGWTDQSTAPAAISHDAANGRLNLDGAADRVSAAEQAVATTNTDQQHVVTFSTHGVPGDVVEFRIGTTSGGAELIADRKLGIGFHAIEFTPDVSPFYIQFRNPNGKTVAVDTVALLDGEPLEIQAPWPSDDGEDLIWAQKADVLYVVHPDHWPRKLERRGHATWSLIEIDFIDGPHLDENVTQTTLTAGAANGYGVTVTASATSGINDDDVGFVSTDVGRALRIRNGSDWAWGRIVEVTNSATVKVDHRGDVDFPLSAVDAWQIGLWSETTGFPSFAFFMQSRLCFLGAHRVYPHRCNGSRTGDYETFRPGTEDDDPLNFDVGSGQVSVPRWGYSRKGMQIGTRTSEIRVTADTDRTPITPLNKSPDPQNEQGSANIAPVMAGNSLLYVSRSGRRLYSSEYTIEVDGYKSPDMARRAEHITASGIKQVVWQQEPYSCVWVRRADGKLVAMTFERGENVVGWHRHPIGGNALCESLMSLPSDGPTGNELWAVNCREINGQTRRYVELLGEPFYHDTDVKDQCFTDSFLIYEGAPTTVINNLHHVEGCEVDVLADGQVQTPKTVVAGSIELDEEASRVIVGPRCRWKVIPQRLEAGSSTGTAQTLPKNVNKCTIRFHRSAGVKVADIDREDRFTPVVFREVKDPMDNPAPLRPDQDYEVDFTGGWNRAGDMVFVGDSPQNATMVAIVPDVTGGEP